MPECVCNRGGWLSVDNTASCMCETCLVVNILWLIILVVRVDRPTDCQYYYCCLSPVVIRCSKCHTQTLFQRALKKGWTKNTADELNTDILTMDFCQKTNPFPSRLTSRCFTLTCTVHVISRVCDGVVQALREKRKQHNEKAR